MTTDITKIYRQIQIHPDDADYQRIVWRSTPSQPVTGYRLLTVTYGTTAVLYFALRVLKQLTEDKGKSFPRAVPVILQQTYIDDCLFGADDVNSSSKTCDQTIAILARGGLCLHKWAGNHSDLLQDFKTDDPGLAYKDLKYELDDGSIKILGIVWRPIEDAFSFKISPLIIAVISKRTIL